MTGPPWPAVVLVGGEGLRLRPLTDDLPKPMIPVAGRPLIGRLLDHLAASGVVGDLHLASGYRAEAFRGLDSPPFRLWVEPSARGTAGAVGDLAEALQGPVWVLNGDALVPVDLAGMARLHRALGASATLAAVWVEDASRYGTLDLEEGGLLKAFREKEGRPGPAWINGGVYLLGPEVVRGIPAERPCSFEREVFPALLREGGRVAVFLHRGYFRDLGTPESYRQAVFDLLEGVRREEGVVVDATAELRPPLYLGRGVRVGPGARVLGPAAREAGVAVGAGATVEGSILWEGCAVAPEVVVRDAILGRGVSAAEDLAGGVVVASGAPSGRESRGPEPT